MTVAGESVGFDSAVVTEWTRAVAAGGCVFIKCKDENAVTLSLSKCCKALWLAQSLGWSVSDPIDVERLSFPINNTGYNSNYWVRWTFIFTCSHAREIPTVTVKKKKSCPVIHKRAWASHLLASNIQKRLNHDDLFSKIYIPLLKMNSVLQGSFPKKNLFWQWIGFQEQLCMFFHYVFSFAARHCRIRDSVLTQLRLVHTWVSSSFAVWINDIRLFLVKKICEKKKNF